MLIKCLLTCGMLLLTGGAWSQPYTIKMDSKGKLLPQLPEHLKTSDQLNFSIPGSTENMAAYTAQLVARYQLVKTRIEKMKASQDVMNILQNVYGITSADLNNVKADLDKVINNPGNPGTLLYVPNYTSQYKCYALKTPGAIKTFDGNEQVSGISCNQSAGQLEFTLTQNDPYKKLAFEWLNQIKGSFQLLLKLDEADNFRKDLSEIPGKANAFLQAAQPILSQASKASTDQAKQALIPQLTNIQQQAAALTATVNGFCTNTPTLTSLLPYKNWILKWLWYTDVTTPQLNPFSFINPGSIEVPDTIQADDLRKRISMLDNAAAKTSAADVTALTKLADQAAEYKKQIAGIQKQYNDSRNKLSKDSNAIKDFCSTSTQLNKGIFAVDKGDIIYWMRHHDAANNNQLVNDDVRDEYLENARVVILAHNLLPNEKEEIHIGYTPITNDNSLLSEEFDNIIKQLIAILPRSTGTGPRGAAFDKQVADAGTEINKLKVALEALERCANIKIINYYYAQAIPLLDLQETADVAHSYHSQVVNPAKKITGPKQAVYYLNKSAVAPSGAAVAMPAPDTFAYRINKLYRLFPMAGVNYTFTRFNDVDSGGQPNHVSYQRHVHFVIGLKAYIQKTDIRSKKSIFEKDDSGRWLFLSRTSIAVSFDAARPLDNLYTGLGFDIWPGFCINAGCNLNRYTYNQYVNGENVRSSILYRPGFYVGVSTDLTLFADIAKLLNL